MNYRRPYRSVTEVATRDQRLLMGYVGTYDEATRQRICVGAEPLRPMARRDAVVNLKVSNGLVLAETSPDSTVAVGEIGSDMNGLRLDKLCTGKYASRCTLRYGQDRRIAGLVLLPPRRD